MKVIETIIGPILKNRLKNKCLPPELQDVIRNEYDCLEVGKHLSINCKSSIVSISWNRSCRWDFQKKKFVFETEDIECKLSEFLHALHDCGVSDRLTLSRGLKDPRRNDRLTNILYIWIKEGCSMDDLIDTTIPSDISFIDYSKRAKKETLLDQFMPSPFERHNMEYIGTYTVTKPTSCDPPYRPIHGEIDLSEEMGATTKAYARAFRLAQSSLMPCELSAFHTNLVEGSDQFDVLKTMVVSTDNISLKSKQKTASRKSSGMAILIIPRASGTVYPISSYTMPTIISELTVAGPSDASDAINVKGRWIVDTNKPIRVIDSGAANLMSDTEWKQITGIILTDQKISSQWLEKWGVADCSSLAVLLTTLSKKIMLIYPTWTDDESGASSRMPILPYWISRVYPINCMEYNSIASIVHFVNFNRNVRHNDSETLNQMFQSVQNCYETKKRQGEV